jgi:hypothetical protein
MQSAAKSRRSAARVPLAIDSAEQHLDTCRTAQAAYLLAVSLRRLAISSKTTPTVIALSATLKAGQCQAP